MPFETLPETYAVFDSNEVATMPADEILAEACRRALEDGATEIKASHFTQHRISYWGEEVWTPLIVTLELKDPLIPRRSFSPMKPNGRPEEEPGDPLIDPLIEGMRMLRASHELHQRRHQISLNYAFDTYGGHR